ncbi:unnamed protein product [Caenorhabditis auriculariae]|uniref:C2H2-type domain-containing protein n=1 Tax=Caenorhabditis auriculariae TaxID=2777116 RepID=A0A8S1H9G8_9PELO|nr:unnamed protein product [Caenorhabditis auriculariae]
MASLQSHRKPGAVIGRPSSSGTRAVDRSAILARRTNQPQFVRSTAPPVQRRRPDVGNIVHGGRDEEQQIVEEEIVENMQDTVIVDHDVYDNDVLPDEFIHAEQLVVYEDETIPQIGQEIVAEEYVLGDMAEEYGYMITGEDGKPQFIPANQVHGLRMDGNGSQIASVALRAPTTSHQSFSGPSTSYRRQQPAYSRTYTHSSENRRQNVEAYHHLGNDEGIRDQIIQLNDGEREDLADMDASLPPHLREKFYGCLADIGIPNAEEVIRTAASTSVGTSSVYSSRQEGMFSSRAPNADEMFAAEANAIEQEEEYYGEPSRTDLRHAYRQSYASRSESGGKSLQQRIDDIRAANAIEESSDMPVLDMVETFSYPNRGSQPPVMDTYQGEQRMSGENQENGYFVEEGDTSKEELLKCPCCGENLRRSIYYHHVKTINKFGSCNASAPQRYPCTECAERFATVEKLCEHMYQLHNAPTQVQIQEFETEEDFGNFLSGIEGRRGNFKKGRGMKKVKRGVVQYFRCNRMTKLGKEKKTETSGGAVEVKREKLGEQAALNGKLAEGAQTTEDPPEGICTAFIVKAYLPNGRIEVRFCEHHLHTDDRLRLPVSVKRRLYDMSIKRLPPVAMHRVLLAEIDSFCPRGSPMERRIRALTSEDITNLLCGIHRALRREMGVPDISLRVTGPDEKLPENPIDPADNAPIKSELDDVEPQSSENVIVNEHFTEEMETQKKEEEDQESLAEGKFPETPAVAEDEVIDVVTEEVQGPRNVAIAADNDEDTNEDNSMADEYLCLYNPDLGIDVEISALTDIEQRELDAYELSMGIELSEEQQLLRSRNRMRLSASDMCERMHDAAETIQVYSFMEKSATSLHELNEMADEAVDLCCKLQATVLQRLGEKIDAKQIKIQYFNIASQRGRLARQQQVQQQLDEERRRRLMQDRQKGEFDYYNTQPYQRQREHEDFGAGGLYGEEDVDVTSMSPTKQVARPAHLSVSPINGLHQMDVEAGVQDVFEQDLEKEKRHELKGLPRYLLPPKLPRPRAPRPPKLNPDGTPVEPKKRGRPRKSGVSAPLAALEPHIVREETVLTSDAVVVMSNEIVMLPAEVVHEEEVISSTSAEVPSSALQLLAAEAVNATQTSSEPPAKRGRRSGPEREFKSSENRTIPGPKRAYKQKVSRKSEQPVFEQPSMMSNLVPVASNHNEVQDGSIEDNLNVILQMDDELKKEKEEPIDVDEPQIPTVTRTGRVAEKKELPLTRELLGLGYADRVQTLVVYRPNDTRVFISGERALFIGTCKLIRMTLSPETLLIVLAIAMCSLLLLFTVAVVVVFHCCRVDALHGLPSAVLQRTRNSVNWARHSVFSHQNLEDDDDETDECSGTPRRSFLQPPPIMV